ncbi:epsilon-sarcoglycan [Plakobranchus ocellatus]|uniref:Epsilon-sarcoglycan n=1 Tax=Plakobranchus ocellatus TaxID=259542 RepID=A0AAV3YB97_9GAST|nr:epsilon-sarcoglycan [Plakobranchus ocellatus]
MRRKRMIKGRRRRGRKGGGAGRQEGRLSTMASEADILRMYNPPTECGDERCRDFFLEFIYCVVISCAVLGLIFFIIAIVACCRSKCCRCKNYTALDTQPSAMELEDYNSVRRASQTLRQMSRNRETPIMGSRAGSAVTLDRSHRRNPRNRHSCSSAPGTLQRQHRNRRGERTSLVLEAPPPYVDGLDDSMNGFPLQDKSQRFYVDNDDQRPPTPPPYRTPVDGAFMHPGFLQVSMHSSVTYDDNSDTNGSGAQPLLSQHPHRRGQHSNMSYSSHSQW